MLSYKDEDLSSTLSTNVKKTGHPETKDNSKWTGEDFGVFLTSLLAPGSSREPISAGRVIKQDSNILS